MVCITKSTQGRSAAALRKEQRLARYIVLPTIDPRGIPSYYIVDTADNSRVRRYDCGVWAEHEARRMNGDRETEKDESLLNRLYERLFKKGNR